MAQIGDVHPDDLLPAWHPAHRLTPDEIATIGRVLAEHGDTIVGEYEERIKLWLENLPPIPPRRADRSQWEKSLTGLEASNYYNMTHERTLLADLKSSWQTGKYLRVLLMLTVTPEADANDMVHKDPHLARLRPQWRKDLQAIRNAYEARLDDAKEKAVAEAAAKQS